MTNLRPLVRRLAQPLLWKWYRYYNRRPHWVRMEGLRIHVGPGVFHPRWFLTTRTLTNFALRLVRSGDKVLELGAGNGLLALSCSRAGAQVTASDLNPEAVRSLQKSSSANELPLRVIHSDLFEQIRERDFVYIFINPPYFPREAQNEQELAFFCGSEYAYFERLFSQLSSFSQAQIFMILTDDCELEQIFSIAHTHGLNMEEQARSKKWKELHIIYRCSPLRG